jgi:NDP-sugar pyrophosphorylase family protein
MKAMVLAAGVGSRLRPLTDSRPKALIELGGVPLLEHVLRRLAKAGVDGVIVNAFHLPDQVERFIARRRQAGLRIEVSREEELLDTGGGLKKASWFFDDSRPFLLHNADVLSGIDLGKLYRFHLEQGALATVSVRSRDSARLLLFDKEGRLRGRRSRAGDDWAAAPLPQAEPLAFDGVHVLSPSIFAKLPETGAFPIMQAYLRLAGLGERIVAFRSDAYPWADIGSPEKLAEARRLVETQGLPQ